MKYFLALILSFSVVATADALRVDPRQMTNTGEYVPQNCAVWNDGCNDCEKTDNGYICPPKNCLNMRMGYCRVQKDTAAVSPQIPQQPNTGRPDDCQRWFDGCNTCFNNGDGVSSCTIMACAVYDEPRCLDETEPVFDPDVPNRNPEIPPNCQSWFDGCNGCGVENGRLTFCTERACAPDQYTEPYCTAFKSEPQGRLDTEILEVQIEPEMVDCSAFRRTCLVMNGKPFPDWIDGFDFEPGYLYELRIEKKLRATPRLDVGPYQYTLLEVLNKISVNNDEPTADPKPLIPSQPEPMPIDREPPMTDTVVLDFNVAAEKEDCVGVGPMECLVVNGEYFYDTIAGFDFKPGFEYQLKVARTEAFSGTNMPADANRFQYELVEMLSKSAIAENSGAPENKVEPPSTLTGPALESSLWGFIKFHLFGWMK